ncbi:G1/S-specific cyclin-D3 [Hyperolius riggenbachi]|uniref:G1/S-specific cyclin-D3 n=1 Tax=Hyperolius riggenbachi TaxID=752182 RepID=UPI0035A363CC
MACEEWSTGPRVVRTTADLQLLQDPRVLWNLLAHEKRQMAERVSRQYQQCEITVEMQKLLAYWLLEVCEDQHCEEGVFPLALSYVRMCLSLFPVEKRSLQLLGTVCMLLASKMRDVVPLKVETLAFYTAGSVLASQIREWEVFVLDQLHWDLAVLIAHDFVEQILERLLFSADRRALLSSHSRTYMSVCALDRSLAAFSPSVIAAACIATAVHRLGMHRHFEDDMIAYLAALIQTDREELQNCSSRIEPALSEAAQTSVYQYCSGLPHAS